MIGASLNAEQHSIFNPSPAEDAKAEAKAEAKAKRWAAAERTEAEADMHETAARVAKYEDVRKKAWAAALPGMLAREAERMRW